MRQRFNLSTTQPIFERKSRVGQKYCKDTNGDGRKTATIHGHITESIAIDDCGTFDDARFLTGLTGESLTVKFIDDECLEDPACDRDIRDPDTPCWSVAQVKESAAEKNLENANKWCEDESHRFIRRNNSNPIPDCDSCECVK